MDRLYKNKQLHNEFVEYLEETFQPFLNDIEYFKKGGDKHVCFISANHDQYGTPHLICNYVPKDSKDIECYGSHGYGVDSELILKWFLDFLSIKRQNKLRRILGEPLIELKKINHVDNIKYSNYIAFD